MKKILVYTLGIMAIVGCNQKDERKENSIAKESNIMLEEPVPKQDTSSPNKDEGLALIEGADCLGCHKVDAKLVGPSYQDIANKYTDADVDMLAKKIIEGGTGNWGEIPMTPHSGMSEENAKKMVKYILSLKP
ncbi:c-type cytochrome [Riemerella anatipestifer]|nr:c-type cytochrome [Riemerella anatipestifer]